jgi:chorismate mutase
MRVQAMAGVLLLLAGLLALGCARPEPSTGSRAPAETAIIRLLDLMRQRLLLMHDVARWKWNTRRPIADPERERASLDDIAARRPSYQVSAELTRAFFIAQIEAAKRMQQDDFQRWQAEKRGQFADVPDLALHVRPKIDALNNDLLAALAVVEPFLPDEAVRRQIRRRAAEILTGEGMTDVVRDTAIQPLAHPPS